MKNNIKNSQIVKIATSLKLTVICLLFLIVLVIWGTVYQADQGLFAAKQKFFQSWVLLLFGFIPFPGTVLVLWILFVNLLASLLFRIKLRFSNSGNILTHIGILILLVGGFFTFHFSEESVLNLKEGEGNSFSTAYHQWEFAVWNSQGQVHDIFAFDLDRTRKGENIRFEKLNIDVTIEEYYSNCNAFSNMQRTGENVQTVNSSGLKILKGKKNEKEPAQNIPGLVFTLVSDDGTSSRVLLYGNDMSPTPINIGKAVYQFSIRKKKFPLPFFLKLVDFTIIYYPGSEIVKSYESKVEIESHGFKRETLISMNKPLRYKDYSLFQSRYHIARDGTEYSIFSVVKNSGRLFPYISSFIIFFGLCIHFLMMLFRKKKKVVFGNE